MTFGAYFSTNYVLVRIVQTLFDILLHFPNYASIGFKAYYSFECVRNNIPVFPVQKRNKT